MESVSGESLGLSQQKLIAKVAQSDAGLSFKALLHFQNASGLSLTAIGDVIDLPKSTMRLRRQQNKLSRHESDRLIRLSRIFEQARDLFEGDVSLAREWLASPCRALGSATPLEFAATELGAREVERVIARLIHGVFT